MDTLQRLRWRPRGQDQLGVSLKTDFDFVAPLSDAFWKMVEVGPGSVL